MKDAKQVCVIPNNKVCGVLSAPASKSYLQRAIAIAALGKTPCIIENFYPSDDAKTAIRIAQSLGGSINIEGNKLEITPIVFSSEDVEMNCGEAGLSTRMFSPIAAVFNRTTFVTGEGSILNRPMDMIVDALNQLGAKVSSNNKYLPLQIKGPITAQEIEIDGSESSQLLTGLLIALPLLKANLASGITMQLIDVTGKILKTEKGNVMQQSFNLEGMTSRLRSTQRVSTSLEASRLNKLNVLRFNKLEALCEK